MDQTQTPRRWRPIAVLAALALVLAACGGDDTSDTGGNGEDLGDPVPGGTLRYGVEAETDGLNPARNRFAVSALQMGLAVFDPLTALDEDGQWQPYLAESIEPNDDYTEWTITLRDGVQFHDGSDLTAEAIVVGIEQQLADPLVSLAVAPVLAEEDQVEQVDELTAVVRTRGPVANFPSFLTGQLGMVASPDWLLAAAEDATLNQRPIGTGPFEFASRTEDSVTRFVRNDNWWRTQQEGIEVHLDSVEFYIQTDPGQRASQLIAGDLEMLHTTEAEAMQLLEGEGGAVVNYRENLGEESFVMINTASEPFDDIRVRQALTYATLRQQYIEDIGLGELEGADTLFHPDLPWNNPDITQEADEPEEAVRLAAEYCSENPAQCSGDRINMSFKYTGPSVANRQIADLLIDGWSVAFNVTRDEVLQDDYITQVAIGDYQVVTWRQFGAVDPDADQVWLDCNSIGGLSLNWPRICNEERQDLLERQRASDDLDEREELWQEIAQTINDDYVYVFLTHTTWDNAARSEVKNVPGARLPSGDPVYGFENGRHFLHQIWIER